jgi:hypothetical protein
MPKSGVRHRKKGIHSEFENIPWIILILIISCVLVIVIVIGCLK